MKLGIVGLPNVGKSTLFNAITSTKNAEAANYPFCTIEPNSGIVAVPDKRLDKLAEIWQTNKKTPAIVEFVDIAGLVKGASQGAGLGNKFLGHIRECDAIVHVVRCFDDDNIIHVVEDVTKAEAVDPIADIEAIDYELILSDLEVVQNRAGRMAKAAKSGNNKGAAAEAAWLQQLADHLSAGKPARSFDFDEGDAEQQTVLHEMGLLSAKPVLYACNVGEDDLMEGIENNKYVPLVAARAKEEGVARVRVHILLDGRDVGRLSPAERSHLISVVLTDRVDVDGMRVKDLVRVGRQPYTGFFGKMSSDDEEVVNKAIADVGMTDFAGRQVNSLSDGERQKVMIAKALAQQTPFILLDEPTAFLDYPSKVSTMEMLRRLCHEQGKTVLLSTHDLDTALRLTDRLWLMADGTLLSGTTETLRTEVSAFMHPSSPSAHVPFRPPALPY